MSIDTNINEVVFEVVAHTEDILVIQTNAGKKLADNLSKIGDDQVLGGLDATGCNQNNVNSANNVTEFGAFNLGLHVGDNAKKVLANRSRLLVKINAYLDSANLDTSQYEQSEKGINNHLENDIKHDVKGNEDSNTITLIAPNAPQIKSMYWLNQIHGHQVIEILPKDGSISSHSLSAPSADAMTTAQPYTALAIMTADCVPIVLYDKTSGQIAAIHAGWKGLANGVIAETYAALKSKSGEARKSRELANTYDIADALINGIDSEGDSEGVKNTDHAVQAWIGACISQPCYEVSRAVVDNLIRACSEMGMDVEAINRQIISKHANPDKAWLDLPRLAVLQLEQLGIDVVASGYASSGYASSVYACSYSNAKYYSYRRKTHLNQLHTGRMAMLIMRLC